MFHLVRLPSTIDENPVRASRRLPALLLPLIAAAQAADEQTMVVTAAPTTVSELDTPAAVSVVNGDEMRQAAPRVNL
jgi:iron complex outermembrane receptor protein